MKTIESIELSSTTDAYVQLFVWFLGDQCPKQGNMVSMKTVIHKERFSDCSGVYDRAIKTCKLREYEKDECAKGLEKSLPFYCNMDGVDSIKICKGHRTSTTTTTQPTTTISSSKGMIVGLAVGGVIFLGILVGVIIYCIKKNKKAKNNTNNSGTTTAGTKNLSTTTGGKTKTRTGTGTGTGTTTKKKTNTGVGTTARY